MIWLKFKKSFFVCTKSKSYNIINLFSLHTNQKLTKKNVIESDEIWKENKSFHDCMMTKKGGQTWTKNIKHQPFNRREEGLSNYYKWVHLNSVNVWLLHWWTISDCFCCGWWNKVWMLRRQLPLNKKLNSQKSPHDSFLLLLVFPSSYHLFWHFWQFLKFLTFPWTKM